MARGDPLQGIEQFGESGGLLGVGQTHLFHRRRQQLLQAKQQLTGIEHAVTAAGAGQVLYFLIKQGERIDIPATDTQTTAAPNLRIQPLGQVLQKCLPQFRAFLCFVLAWHVPWGHSL
ncbi:MAG: hypothetical protein COS34_11610 [Lysobacterales bacterium CG02_land_8_20_14_3_00_62_12]|nr:MAG: hypothetical protein COS34_11610 [Xanthomonadales bacterium CG02_land_8_20_14_3_00_62_12]